VESVAWISERKDMLSGLFFMLTLGAYLRYVERPASLSRYLAVILLFALGLMCKPMLVTLPFVLLLLDYWPLHRLFQPPPTPGNSTGGLFVNWRAVVEKFPLLALSFALCVATMLAPKETGYSVIEQIPFGVRLGEIPVSVATYLGQMVRPAGLAVIYPHSEQTFAWWPAALALCGLLSVGIFLLRKNYPFLWMGWLWNLGMLVPVSGIVQISRHARADHYNYLPQIGLYVGVTWAVAEWSKEWRHRRWVLGALSTCVILALLVCARIQTACWRNSESLWAHALACTKRNPLAHNNLGNAFLQKGQTEEAIVQYREAARINPAYSEAMSNLAYSLATAGDGRLRNGREALEVAQRANDLTKGGAPILLGTLAAAYAETGRFGEAEETARRAIELAKAQGNPALAGTFQEHLKLYQARQPLRSGPGF